MILSVDGGATKTVALAYDEAKMEIRGLGLAGPTNLTSVPREEVISNLRIAISEACEESGIKVSDFRKGLFGIAGIGDSKNLTVFGRNIIQEATSREDFIAINDGRPAYEMANLEEDGIVFAGGTGSVAFFKIGDRIERRGGWNWFAGDNGSASWIAKRGLNLATFEYDGILDGIKLVQATESYFKNDFKDTMASFEKSQNKRYIAGFAPSITALASSGYPSASLIMDECADYVSDLIKSLLPNFSKDPRISMVGGTMLAGKTYTGRVAERLQRPVNVYYGYQVACGGLIIILKELRTKCTFETRDDILSNLEIFLKKKSKEKLKQFLNLN